MSHTDSFIEEVTEEVRRDKLFAFFKKFAWVFIGIIILIVGGAATNEYLKSKATSEAQATGEALKAAEARSTVAAFAPIADSGAPASVVAKLDEAAILLDKADRAGAAGILDSIAKDTATPAVYRDLALLKMVMINGANMEDATLFEVLDKLAQPGAPFRLLALEQRAIAYVRTGDIAAAKGDLVVILLDQNTTQGLRNRAQQLTVALGGQVPAPAAVTAPATSDG